MKKEHIDSELYEILHFTPEVSHEIQNKIETAYDKIKSGQTTMHRKKKFRSGLYLGLAAAILLVIGFLGFSNPVLAGKIPFIGRIFQMIEGQVGYPGNYSEYSVPLTDPATDEDNSENTPGTASENENLADDTDISSNIEAEESSVAKTDVYSQTVGDVTITLSEACYNDMALYFSLELYSEEGFPDSFSRMKNVPGYILSYDWLNMQSSQIFDFSQADPDLYCADTFSATIEEGYPTPWRIEGNYADSHTFLGIVRVDLEVIRNRMKIDNFPPEFIYTLTINNFWGETDEVREVPLTDPDTGEVIIIKNFVQKHYEGPWSFTFPVSLDTTGTQVKEIMETNADGIGISTVTKTRYEIKADIILPEGAKSYDYIIAITDADGKILDSQGEYAEIYSVYGRNTDIVHVYVVDFFTFMDECKAENAYLLPQKALFQTTIEW